MGQQCVLFIDDLNMPEVLSKHTTIIVPPYYYHTKVQLISFTKFSSMKKIIFKLQGIINLYICLNTWWRPFFVGGDVWCAASYRTSTTANRQRYACPTQFSKYTTLLYTIDFNYHFLVYTLYICIYNISFPLSSPSSPSPKIIESYLLHTICTNNTCRQAVGTT